MTMQDNLPTLRWGIIGTGLVASWFVSDIILSRPDAKARHIIKAVGSSMVVKGIEVVEKNCPEQRTKVYGNYYEVYDDPEVDIVYIATPHALHKKNCIDAIQRGKNVLCEKPLAINKAEAQVLVDLAKAKNVFLMEGVWTRYTPLVARLKELIHVEHIIGEVSRVFVDFGLDMNLQDLPSDSRLKSPELGKIILDTGLGLESTQPSIAASQSVVDGMDYISSVILTYPGKTPRQGILTCSLCYKTAPEFMRIEGSHGSILVSGQAASYPDTIVVRHKDESKRDESLSFSHVGFGFYYEADAAALDILNGRKNNSLLPLDETLFMLNLMDNVRAIGGLVYPQDG
ncbi:hypothetical protein V1523DRAFT_436698 [Lipomyces doorenjongii]